MKSGWRIGSVLGIPLFLDPSWFFILVLVTIIYGSEWQSYDVADGMEWVIGFCMALLLFSSVLMHELGHSLVALSQGIRVHSITLFLFGGIAAIEKESKTPGQAFQVAIAGPAVSFGLFLGLTVTNFVLDLDSSASLMLSRLASINLILTVFNMMPGLPLDGGQVLKSIIWKTTGDRLKGIRWAAFSGQLFGWIAVCLGILLYLNSFEPVLLWLAIIGWFGIRNAKGYGRMADIQTVLLTLRTTDVMRREFRVVDASLSIQAFIQQYLVDTPSDQPVFKTQSSYFAASQGRYRGYVDLNHITNMDRDEWDNITVGEVVTPLSQIPSVYESESLAYAIQMLDQHQCWELTVLSPSDSVSGAIDRKDIVQRILHDLKLELSPEGMETLVQSQDYPPELPLMQLARTLIEDEQRLSLKNSGQDMDSNGEW